MAARVLYYLNDNVIRLEGAQNSDSLAYINNATVTLVVVDKNGAQVSGVTWPQTMAYVAASNGNYDATLPHTVSFRPNREYNAQVTLSGSGGEDAYWEFLMECQVRTS